MLRPLAGAARLLCALLLLPLTGNAQGPFAPARRVAVGTFPAALASGDFDGDGLLDVACANLIDGTVSALPATGSATLSSSTAYPVGMRARDVAVEDFDGDGMADVVALDDLGARLGVFLGSGSGALASAGLYAATSGAQNAPSALACGDLDGDGRSDLLVLVTGPFAQPSELYRLDNLGGSGPAWRGFSTPFALPVAVNGNFVSGLTDLVIADLDLDGRNDVAAAHEGFFFQSPGSSVYLFAGDGAGGIGAGQGFFVGSNAGPTRIDLADADGDGDLDLATANRFSGDVSVLRNRGLSGGAWEGFGQWYQVAGQSSQFTAANATDVQWVRDLNGDGALELVIAESTRHRVGVLYSDPVRGYLFGGHAPVGLSPLSIALVNDAIVAADSGDNDVAVLSLDELPVAAAGGGNVGITGGGPFELLTIDGSAGGEARTVAVATGQGFTLRMDYPTSNASGSAAFALWGRIGPPAPGDFFYAPGVGALSFAPCPLAPGFTLLDNVGLGTCSPALSAAPLAPGKPWRFSFPSGIAVPFEVSFQGVVFGLENTLQVTNAVVLEVL